jgi:hypothetical protein
LLNLISNGFYAAIRRKIETGAGSFEPMSIAATQIAGSEVEIRIRRNGSGIPTGEDFSVRSSLPHARNGGMSPQQRSGLHRIGQHAEYRLGQQLHQMRLSVI